MGQMMSNLGNKDVMDPNQAKWGDLSGNEKGARLLGGATSGLGTGLQNQQQQQQGLQNRGGGAMPMPQAAAPVSPDYFAPQAPQPSQIRKPGNNNFYGGGM